MGKSGDMTWAGHVARMEKRGILVNFRVNLQWKRLLWRSKRRWKGGVKILGLVEKLCGC